ncbi:MAG: hypothetical protein NC124_03555 [Clostridium sp.]|nr:hypothetical protein [Clostridium sp.]
MNSEKNERKQDAKQQPKDNLKENAEQRTNKQKTNAGQPQKDERQDNNRHFDSLPEEYRHIWEEKLIQIQRRVMEEILRDMQDYAIRRFYGGGWRNAAWSARKDGQRDISEGKENTFASIIAKFTKERIQEIQNVRMKTGFRNLDEMLGGGISAGLIVLGAVSSLGKSTIALQIAQNMAKQGVTVLFFSMEMTTARIASKAISRQIFLDAKADNEKIPPETLRLIESDAFFDAERTEQFSKKDWEMVRKAQEAVIKESAYLRIIETAQTGADIYNYTSRHIRNREPVPAGKNRAKADGKLAVMVDYLQILQSANDRYNNSKLIVDDNVRILKDLSREFDIPVLLISSVNRENYNKPIAFESFKESGNIEYTADEVLGLQFKAVHQGKSFDINAEKAGYPRLVEVVALKQRYRQCNGSAEFAYYTKYDCFVEEDGTPEGNQASAVKGSSGRKGKQEPAAKASSGRNEKQAAKANREPKENYAPAAEGDSAPKGKQASEAEADSVPEGNQAPEPAGDAAANEGKGPEGSADRAAKLAWLGEQAPGMSMEEFKKKLEE